MALSIKSDEIIDGMILAEPVINKFGQSLLPVGVELRQSHIKLLKTWNISTVTVKDKDDDKEIEINPEQYDLAKEILTAKLKWEPTNNIEHDLLETGIMHIAKQLNTKVL